MMKEIKERMILGTGVAGVFTMGIGNMQLHELSNDIKELNNTMIVIVQKQQHSDLTLRELKIRIKDLEEFKIEVIKNVDIK